MNYTITVGWLYPDLMSIYGDRGNIIILTKRCQWRDIAVCVHKITLETSITKMNVCDLFFMGGAQDRQQQLISKDFLQKKAPVLKQRIESGIPTLLVCAAYQLAGHYYRPYQGNDIPGSGIFDLVTHHPGDQAKRLIGNIVAKLINPAELAGTTIVGFENHGGRTKLGPKMYPLAKVIHGYGNNGDDEYEGAIYKNAIGSYFHGPMFTKNPHVADWLITKALEMKYNKAITLPPLEDTLEWKAHEFCRMHRR